jgi:hypothetical protein
MLRAFSGTIPAVLITRSLTQLETFSLYIFVEELPNAKASWYLLATGTEQINGTSDQECRPRGIASCRECAAEDKAVVPCGGSYIRNGCQYAKPVGKAEFGVQVRIRYAALHYWLPPRRWQPTRALTCRRPSCKLTDE